MYADEGPGYDEDVPRYGDWEYERPFKPVYGAATVYPVSDGVYLEDIAAYDPDDYKRPSYYEDVLGY